MNTKLKTNLILSVICVLILICCGYSEAADHKIQNLQRMVYINQVFDIPDGIMGKDGKTDMKYYACGPTSVTMALSYFGKKKGTPEDVKDVYSINEAYMKRTGRGYYFEYGPGASYINSHGAPDVSAVTFSNISMDKIKENINNNKVIIYGGTIGSAALAHVIVIIGYDDDNNVIAYDPYGDGHDYTWSTANANGKYVKYSTSLINISSNNGIVVSGPVNFYDYELVNQSDYPTIQRGNSANGWIVLKNIGNIEWKKGVFNLGVKDDKNSVYAGTTKDGWLSSNRITLKEDTPVGGYGTFEFKWLTNNAPVDATEYFIPVVDSGESAGWLKDIGIFWRITVIGDYDYEHKWNTNEMNLNPGDTTEVTIKLKNTGNKNWITGSDGFSIMSVYPDGHYNEYGLENRCPIFKNNDNSWERVEKTICDKYVKMVPSGNQWHFPDKPVYLDTTVKPGSEKDFTFKIQILNGFPKGNYRLFFRPVARWGNWSQDFELRKWGKEGIYWTFNVGGNNSTQAIVDTSHTTPNSAGFINNGGGGWGDDDIQPMGLESNITDNMLENHEKSSGSFLQASIEALSKKMNDIFVKPIVTLVHEIPSVGEDWANSMNMWFYGPENITVYNNQNCFYNGIIASEQQSEQVLYQNSDTYVNLGCKWNRIIDEQTSPKRDFDFCVFNVQKMVWYSVTIAGQSNIFNDSERSVFNGLTLPPRKEICITHIKAPLDMDSIITVNVEPMKSVQMLDFLTRFLFDIPVPQDLDAVMMLTKELGPVEKLATNLECFMVNLENHNTNAAAKCMSSILSDYAVKKVIWSFVKKYAMNKYNIANEDAYKEFINPYKIALKIMGKEIQVTELVQKTIGVGLDSIYSANVPIIPVTGEKYYYTAQIIDPVLTGADSLKPTEERVLRVVINNYGNITWNHIKNSQKVYVAVVNLDDKRINNSKFMSEAWISNDTILRLPDEIRPIKARSGSNDYSFRISVPIKIKAPDFQGVYDFCVKPVVDSGELMKGNQICWKIQVVSAPPTTTNGSSNLGATQANVEQSIYDYDFAGQDQYPQIKQGSSATWELTIKNTGTMIWMRDGVNPIRLGTPKDESSRFYSTSWRGANRIDMVESQVRPGETGTFLIELNVPKDMPPGTYRQNFVPVVDGLQWMKDINMFVDITVLPATSAGQATSNQSVSTTCVSQPPSGQTAYYDYIYVTQDPNPTVKLGEKKIVRIKLKNTGNVTWCKSGSNPVRLGTSNQQDRSSKFVSQLWLSDNRVGMVEDQVRNGETGTFEIEFYANPSKVVVGSYQEYFRPVVEGKDWLRDIGIYSQITVEKASTITTISSVPVQPIQTVAITQTLPTSNTSSTPSGILSNVAPQNITELRVNGSQITGAVDYDKYTRYSFPVIADGGIYTLTVLPMIGDPDIYGSKNPNVNRDVSDSSSIYPSGMQETFSFVAPSNGNNFTFYVAVYGRSASSYYIKVSNVKGVSLVNSEFLIENGPPISGNVGSGTIKQYVLTTTGNGKSYEIKLTGGITLPSLFVSDSPILTSSQKNAMTLNSGNASSMAGNLILDEYDGISRQRYAYVYSNNSRNYLIQLNSVDTSVKSGVSNTRQYLYGGIVNILLTCKETGIVKSIEYRCRQSDIWTHMTGNKSQNCSYSDVGSYMPGCRLNNSLIDNSSVIIENAPISSMSITVNPTQIVADNISTSTIKISAKDDRGNPVSGAIVNLTTTAGGSLSSNQITINNGTGQALFTAGLGSTRNTVTLTATSGQVTNTTSLLLLPTVPPSLPGN